MKALYRLSRQEFQKQAERRGVFFALAIICLFGVLTFVGMSVDLGMITVTKTRMQSAADAACLAAAQEIVIAVREAAQNGVTDPTEVQSYAVSEAKDTAEHVAQLNGFWIDKETDVIFGSRLLSEDGESYTESWGAPPYNMVQVNIRKDNNDPTAGDAKLPFCSHPLLVSGSTPSRHPQLRSLSLATSSPFSTIPDQWLTTA